MSEPCEVLVKVVSQQGTCEAGHKVGDEFVLGLKSPSGFCLPALISIYPFVRVLRFGGGHPWQSDPDVLEATACPDAKNPVVFELQRLRK